MSDRSALIGRLTRGERIVVLAGAVAVIVAAMNIARPTVAALRQREQKIAERRVRLASMRQLGVAASAAGATSGGGARTLGGRTPALAAQELHSLLRRYVEASRVSVTSLEVIAVPQDPGTMAVVPMVAATLSGSGDLQQVTELIASIQRGPRVLEIADLSISREPSRGAGLQVTLTVRGPWIARN